MPKYIAQQAVPDTADHIARLPAGSLPAGPISVTGGDVRYGLVREGLALSVDAPLWVDRAAVGTVDGQRVYAGDLEVQDQYADGWLNGASLRVMGERNGRFQEIYEGTVVDTACGTHSKLTGTGYSISSEFRWTPDYLRRPDFTMYFWVAAVDAAGNRSPWAAPVTWATASSIGGGAAVVNDTSTAVALTGAVDASIPVPTGVAASSENSGKTVVITALIPAGAIGIIVWQTDTARAPIERANTYFVVDGDPTAIQSGDIAIWSKEFDHTTRKGDVIYSGYWGKASLSARFGIPGTPGLPFQEQSSTVLFEYRVDPDGTRYLRITNNGATNFAITKYLIGTTAQGYYTVLEPGVTYRHSVRARSAASSQMMIRTNGLADGIQPETKETYFALTPAWTDCHADFSRATLDTTKINDVDKFPCGLHILPGTSVDIATCPETGGGWTVYDARYGATGFDARTRDLANDADIFRIHAAIKTRPWSYDLGRLTDPDMLPRILRELQIAGLTPWLQVEIHLSRADWLGLVEYLCAPYDPADPTHADRAWARKRYSQGQSTPWIEIFASWLIELSNEAWQSPLMTEFWTVPSKPWSTAGRARNFALWTDWAIEVMESSPYWRPGKFGLNPATGRYAGVILGGWTISSEWNATLCSTSKRGGQLAITNYVAGWDQGIGPVPDLSVLSSAQALVANAAIIGRRQQVANATAAAGGLPLIIYEGGPNYQLKQADGKTALTTEQALAQHIAMKSVAAGTATALGWWIDFSMGISSPNYFVLGHNNRNWASHVPPLDGGGATAAWMWTGEWWQRHIVGGRGAGLADTDTRRHQVIEIDGAAIPATWLFRADNAGRIYIAAFNLDLTAEHTLRPLTAIPAGRTCTRHYLSTPNHPAGEGWRAHNTTTETLGDVILTSEPYAYDPAHPLTIPPGQLEVYEFS